MKKLLALLLAGVMVFSLTACGNKGEEETTTAGTEEKVTFTVGFDASYPPYGYMNTETGEYTGFDLELAEAVCELEGWELVKTPIDWDSKDMELDSGNIDCIWNGFTINGREDKYEWSVPYVNNSQVVVVATDSGIKSLADLAGKNVGTQVASAALELLQEGGDQADLGATFGNIQEFANYETAFAELEMGTVDAVAMDVGVAKYQIESRGEGFVILEETLKAEQYGVGFKLGNTELRDKINADLDKLAADGTIKELAEKYDIADMICIGNE